MPLNGAKSDPKSCWWMKTQTFLQCSLQQVDMGLLGNLRKNYLQSLHPLPHQLPSAHNSTPALSILISHTKYLPVFLLPYQLFLCHRQDLLLLSPRCLRCRCLCQKHLPLHRLASDKSKCLSRTPFPVLSAVSHL